MLQNVPCDRCSQFRALAQTKVRLALGRSNLALCSDCVAYYHARHQVVGRNLAPIGAQTAPPLGPRPGAEPSLMPRLPTPPPVLPPELRRLRERLAADRAEDELTSRDEWRGHPIG